MTDDAPAAPSAELRLDQARTAYAPGEEVAGSVSWELAFEPESVALRLYWRTEGRGSEDLDVVEEIDFAAPGLRDRRDFRFRLPAGPYSFSGKLISLIWGLELVADPQGALARGESVVSHTGAEVVIGRPDEEENVDLVDEIRRRVARQGQEDGEGAGGGEGRYRR